jgi:CheY-like chemotaxis protein
MKKGMMGTILYIDESESFRFVLREQLSEEGYKVLTTCSSEEALSKFKRAKPSLIILEFGQKNGEKEPKD